MLRAPELGSYPAYTIFEYLYCDAGNFKARGSVLLAGSMSTVERDAIVSKMESREFFIAEQIGIATLCHVLYETSGGPTSDDHVWHTFEGFREVADLSSYLDETCWGTVREFIQRFDEVVDWNLLLSPHSNLLCL